MTIEQVDLALAELDAINPNDEFAYEKALTAFTKMQSVPVIDLSMDKPIDFFRARRDNDDIFFKKIDEIGVTPDKFIAYFGRCNRPYQSKFYSSENRPTSYMEIAESILYDRNVGDITFITIGQWRSNRAFRFIIVTSPDPEKRISEFDKHCGEKFDKIINKYPAERRDATIKVYEYLFEKFRKDAKKDPHTYLITAAYSNLAMSQMEDIAAICYPSVPFQQQGLNFAFNKTFVKGGKIELVSAARDKFIVVHNEHGIKSLKQLETHPASQIDGVSGVINW
ncbi:MAG: hypothetical protein ACN6PI_17340 [Sphingobacterium siyangense]